MKILSNFQYILDEASKKGINFEVVSENEEISCFSLGKKKVYVYKKHLPFNNTVGPKISKDKNLTKKVLGFYGVNTPKGILTSSVNEAKQELSNGNLKFPLVVKPNDKALGEDVHALLESDSEFEKFLSLSFKKNKKVLVENYYEGDDFRFLILNYKVIAVAKREKPYIIGDGVKTVSELVDELDSSRERKVLRDDEFLRITKKQVSGLNEIVVRGKKVILRGNCNFRTGGILANVTDEVSDYYKGIAIRCARALTLRFCGVDFLITDHKNKSEYVVTEVNSVPGMDAHMVADYGNGINVAAMVLNEMFEEAPNE